MNLLVNTERLLNAIRRVSAVAGKPALNAILRRRATPCI